MAVAETLDVRVRGAWRAPLLVLAALAGAALLARFLSGSGIGAARTFLLVFGSLLVEALPFILLGAAVSALIEVFVPASVFARLARLPRGLQMPVAGLGGFAFPVCECGSVPVARRLLLKGLHPTAAVTFMLAAPILNPVVLLATAIAYRGRDVMWPMLLGRAGLGLVVAMAVGWAVGARARGTELLRPGRRMEEHAHDGAGSTEGRWTRYFGHLADDFTMLARYLVIGAGIAAALQTFLPQDVIGRVATTPVLDVVALMVLAAALSLCSESDAFVAASFVQFGMASQLAFLVAGPMIDAKLAALYGGTFGRGFVRTVAIVVFAVTLAGSLWIQVAFG
ncbi:MAG TPA: permease [Actinomycetota bacterium]|nr:permease [Actinomycetota bacterium]